MNATKHLVIMAAGTGGHVIPGLAVAKEVQACGWTVSWLGTKTGMENRLVKPSGIELDAVAFSGLRGKGLVGNIKGGLQLIQAVFQCWAIFRKRKPSVVLGMGGYVCVPGALITALTGKPLMLVNADAALLMSTKWLIPFANRIAFGFAGASVESNRKALVTGNPVRHEIEQVAPPSQRFLGRSGPLKVLVVGGSSGAKVLNDVVPLAMARISATQRPLLTHQTGTAHIDEVAASYRALSVDANLVAFIEDMPKQLSECDVIICRAGAITVSELCAAGVASVLVPLVVKTTSHQRDNAQWLEGKAAGIHLPQCDLNPEKLAYLISELKRENLLAIATRARNLARPNAAKRVADELEALLKP